MSKLMTAKFNSRCAETGQQIKKGDRIFYDSTQRKAYASTSERYKAEQNRPDEAAHAIQANEEAFFDNFCQRNNI